MFYPNMTGHKNLAFANCKSRGSNISNCQSVYIYQLVLIFVHDTPKIKLSNLHYAFGLCAQTSVGLLLFIGANTYRGYWAIKISCNKEVRSKPRRRSQ